MRSRISKRTKDAPLTSPRLLGLSLKLGETGTGFCSLTVGRTSTLFFIRLRRVMELGPSSLGRLGLRLRLPRMLRLFSLNFDGVSLITDSEGSSRSTCYTDSESTWASYSTLTYLMHLGYSSASETGSSTNSSTFTTDRCCSDSFCSETTYSMNSSLFSSFWLMTFSSLQSWTI